MKKTFFFLSSLLCLNSFCQNEPPARLSETGYGNNSKTGHYVQAGDARTYYEVYGKGRPIVILHGGITGSFIK